MWWPHSLTYPTKNTPELAVLRHLPHSRSCFIWTPRFQMLSRLMNFSSNWPKLDIDFDYCVITVHFTHCLPFSHSHSMNVQTGPKRSPQEARSNICGRPFKLYLNIVLRADEEDCGKSLVRGIYTSREREREKWISFLIVPFPTPLDSWVKKCALLCAYIYIYIYLYIRSGLDKMRELNQSSW